MIHQAKNICEQTVFVVTGETKDEKTFDILFVDNRNAGASLLAEHYARRAYPEAGSFKSAGWESGEEVDPAFAAFAEEKGFSMIGVEPRPLDSIQNTLHDYDIIIDLTGKARNHIPKVPFHTTLLSWPIPDRTEPEAVYRELAPRLSALVERLRGDED